eukprot:PLAT6455.7.p1 GENE.PLAT6455.7~~PLAT6455.7.p1  ORF type:complete len:771 (-),score=334.59 PLAT6455.7:61-2373(-)
MPRDRPSSPLQVLRSLTDSPHDGRSGEDTPERMRRPFSRILRGIRPRAAALHSSKHSPGRRRRGRRKDRYKPTAAGPSSRKDASAVSLTLPVLPDSSAKALLAGLRASARRAGPPSSTPAAARSKGPPVPRRARRGRAAKRRPSPSTLPKLSPPATSPAAPTSVVAAGPPAGSSSAVDDRAAPLDQLVSLWRARLPELVSDYAVAVGAADDGGKAAAAAPALLKVVDAATGVSTFARHTAERLERRRERERKKREREAELLPQSMQMYQDEKIFPRWLQERADFQTIFTRFAAKEVSAEDKLRTAIRRPPKERSKDAIHQLVRFLRQFPVMQQLAEQTVTDLTALLRYEHFDAGKAVFMQGDEGTAFYMIFQGAVDVEVNGVCVVTLVESQSFGELALMSNRGRAATVRAASDGAELVSIGSSDYRTTLKSFTESMINDTMTFLKEEVKPFRIMRSSAMREMASIMGVRPVAAGETIVEEGTPAESLFFIRKGSARIVKRVTVEESNRMPLAGKAERRVRVTHRIELMRMAVGDWLAADCLMDATVNSCTAEALEESQLLILSKSDAARLLMRRTKRQLVARWQRVARAAEELREEYLFKRETVRLYSDLKVASLGDKYKARSGGLERRSKLDSVLTRATPDLVLPALTSLLRDARRDGSAKYAAFNLVPLRDQAELEHKAAERAAYMRMAAAAGGSSSGEAGSVDVDNSFAGVSAIAERVRAAAEEEMLERARWAAEEAAEEEDDEEEKKPRKSDGDAGEEEEAKEEGE